MNTVSASVLTVPASGTEILTLDWNKYRPFVIASAGVDKIVKVWDCRMVKMGGEGGDVGGVCEVQLPGHEYAIRRVQWSPHRVDVLATASYDMTCRVYVNTVWDLHFDLTCPFIGGTQVLLLAEPHCCIFTIPTRSLWSVVDGHCMRKVYWQVAGGIAD
jgi:peroxin-7